MKHYRLLVGVGSVSIAIAILACYLWLRPIAADILEDEVITIDESVRRYRVVVPHTLPAEGVPVVFAFHGVGGSPIGMAKYTGLDRLAAKYGFLLVYPAARRGMWATVDIDATQLDDHPDIRFVDQLFDHLQARFDIDPSRVYLVGMSNGASFAQLVAFARPDVAAAVAHSGPKPHSLSEAARPFTIMLLAGSEDLAAEAMSSDAEEYRANNHPVELVVIPGLGHEWSRSHNSAMWYFLSQHRLR